jgi:hypothetical protein
VTCDASWWFNLVITAAAGSWLLGLAIGALVVVTWK